MGILFANLISSCDNFPNFFNGGKYFWSIPKNDESDEMDMSVTKIAGQTETKPMSKKQCRDEPYVRPPNNNRNQTYVWTQM